MLKNENYIVIQGWMINELGLKGNNLLIYAIIYGFSQVAGTMFTGSLRYLMDCTGASKPTVINSLKELEDKGLIVKQVEEKNGVKFNHYFTGSKETLPVVKNFDKGGKEILPGVVKKLYRGSKEILPNNIKDNINNNINNNINTQKFIKPTIEEIFEYCKSRQNNIDAEHFYYFYEARGWTVSGRKMKDWKAAVITWEKHNYNNGSKKGENNGKYAGIGTEYKNY